MFKALTSKIHLKLKLFTHKLWESDSLASPLSVIKEIVLDLSSAQVKYEEEALALMLLCSLPLSYSNLRDIILNSYYTLTINEVYDALHAKKKMKLIVTFEFAANSNGEGFFVRGGIERKKSNNDKSVTGQSVRSI